ncbi:hypothetical protein ACFFJY_18380 [Fictibacillus aquaticus]|uniref:Uncharacterized protein n=1 Tax=Fictibacillus aquaticus TaxID=2021314 RepID=A0A235F5D8_9BACL|nr:hypothetical protein [Fictibacillus aquaticus]OYD56491.1 hypothetical protein CGZ90_15885 [Fictibacillus aquaticus]
MNKDNDSIHSEIPHFRTYLINMFSVLLAGYGTAMILGRPMLAVLFLAAGSVIWFLNRRGSFRLNSMAFVLLIVLLILLISRVFWHNGYIQLDNTMLFIWKAFYFTGTFFGISSLFAALTDLDNRNKSRFVGKYVLHAVYFTAAIIIVPYCVFYFYGLLIFEGYHIELLMPLLLFLAWMLLYIGQTTILTGSKAKEWGGLAAVILLAMYVVTRWNEIL